jgi:ATP-dependent DNA helicase DinG
VLHHIKSTRGGAFVLFTSFGTLYAVADRLRQELEDDGMPVFVQGRDGSRQHILKQFVEHDNAVLFGAASFWQGVDVRGEQLRNVIITRLPFEPPDRPLTQARLERIEDTGGNPFMHDSLPRAIIRFKQGFGRLIRSKTDKGRVVVLDPRIKTARYGKLFLDALPEGVVVEERRGEEFDF